LQYIVEQVIKQPDSWFIRIVGGIRGIPFKEGDVLKTGQKIFHIVTLSILYPNQDHTKDRNYGLILDKEIELGTIVEKQDGTN
jgi:hypothetical protein